MRVYDQATAFMADGQWHPTSEIAQAIGKRPSEVHRAMALAVKYRCVERGNIELVDGHYNRLWRLTP